MSLNFGSSKNTAVGLTFEIAAQKRPLGTVTLHSLATNKIHDFKAKFPNSYGDPFTSALLLQTSVVVIDLCGTFYLTWQKFTEALANTDKMIFQVMWVNHNVLFWTQIFFQSTLINVPHQFHVIRYTTKHVIYNMSVCFHFNVKIFQMFEKRESKTENE